MKDFVEVVRLEISWGIYLHIYRLVYEYIDILCYVYSWVLTQKKKYEGEGEGEGCCYQRVFVHTLACERVEGKRRLRVSQYHHIFLRNSISLFDQLTALFSYCILIAEAIFTRRGRCVNQNTRRGVSVICPIKLSKAIFLPYS